jgi:hypothetical protein
MGIRMTTSASALDAFLQRAARKIQENVLKALSKLGDESVVRIRNRSAEESWIDHTGNLRSSIGFAVYEQGSKYMESAFSQVLSGTDGSVKGKKMINDLAKEYSRVYALVVVAGMEYAGEVEALESKDVLASTKIWATSIVEQRVKTAIDSAVNEINKWKI